MTMRDNLNENEALSGFIGFACSFGGKWLRDMQEIKK